MVMGKSSAGMEDTPGVLGPIEDPYEGFRRKLFAEPVIDVPVFKQRSSFNPTVFVERINYYLGEMWVDMTHKAIQSIKVTQPRRYYHQKYGRVPNLWECYTDDTICIYEAESQFRRDKKVDKEIIRLLEERANVCRRLEGENGLYKCQPLVEVIEKCKYAFEVKYGDLGYHCSAQNVLNKQKNRFIEERYLERHGIRVNGPGSES